MVNKTLLKRLCQTIVLCLLPVLTHAAKITNVHVTNFTSYSRVIFTITNPDKYHVFTLANPARMVVDLYDGHLKADVAYLGQADTNILKVRTGHPVASTLRIVFDMASNVNVKSYVVQDKEVHEAQLVIDVYPKNPVHPHVALHEPAPPQMPVETIKPVKPNKPLAVATYTAEKKLIKPVNKLKPETPIARQRILVPLQVLQKNKSHMIVVVIDPGHGGKDTGTIGTRGTKEKNIVLAIAIRLAELINNEPNMHAVLTRSGDYFVSLRERLNESRQYKADMFIAIHADSYLNNNQLGAAVYALSHHGASSMSARWLADKENHSELGNVELNELGDKSLMLRSVLIDLAETATINDSVKLGTNMLDSLERVTTLHYPHVEQAPFMVLKSPDIPSILVETGFLSNPKEEDRLRDSVYRDKLAHAMLDGIHQYITTHPMLAKN